MFRVGIDCNVRCLPQLVKIVLFCCVSCEAVICQAFKLNTLLLFDVNVVLMYTCSGQMSGIEGVCRMRNCNKMFRQIFCS